MADNISERLAELDFASVTPQEFAKIIKGLSPRQLGEIARGDLRRQVLAEVFGRVERQFRPDSAGSLAAVIRWKITGESDVVYETTIADGVCTVAEGRSEADPRLTLTMGDADFLKLVSGNASPVTLFILRKVKIAGDLGLASGLTRYFDIPKA
ncbi:SCP2 sterol-binding domain-containing protein [Streptomyces sp. NPDC090052]|uniref:SCP2 sterol-binding domain-containing protein n=1 Tax=unclassified Streptomyces TaxID=2593676 RepID=UPI002258807E|nr:SCP2 sterol-binding domain-containing protein [Streptomyces sp. NBC_01306]MCX4722650.1 SCP2 sterol-binding domain-containing protein [Streptomyces sp. NBC_01306]